MTAGRPVVPWTPEMNAKLRKLWAEGKTCTQIAEIMGLPSRSAVSGRAHRMKLTRRANPASVKAAKVKHETRMSLHSAMARAKQKAKDPRRLDTAPQAGRETDRRAELPARPKPASEAVLRPGSECQFPLTNDRPWKFCGDPCEQGFSYCPTHRQACYVAGTANGGQMDGTQKLLDRGSPQYDRSMVRGNSKQQFNRATDTKWGL